MKTLNLIIFYDFVTLTLVETHQMILSSDLYSAVGFSQRNFLPLIDCKNIYASDSVTFGGEESNFLHLYSTKNIQQFHIRVMNWKSHTP